MQYTGGALRPAMVSPTTGGPIEAADRDEDDDLDDDAPAAPRIAPQPTARRAAKTPKLGPAPNVVRIARERLRDVEREIKRLRALEKERDELKRLIEAAATKPRPVVRALPNRSAG